MHKIVAQTQLKGECKLEDISEEVIQNVTQRDNDMKDMKGRLKNEEQRVRRSNIYQLRVSEGYKALC